MYKFIKDGLNIWDSHFMHRQGFRHYSQLLYMYFLTCPLSNLLGVYEITEERIKNDLRLDDGQLITAMHDLKELKKVRRAGKYIIIQDAIHYININAKAIKEIDKIMSTLPEKVRERLPKKAVETIEEYKRKQEDKKIKRLESKLELWQASKDNYKSLPLKDNKEEEDEKKHTFEIEEVESLKDASFMDFDSFIVEPSEASMTACKTEEEIDIQKNDDEEFIKYNDPFDVAPSELSIKKMEEARKRKKKKEMSDEKMFTLLKERLEPIYAKMKDTDFLPNLEVTATARRELLAFMDENNIKADPLDTSFLNMREFMKQAKAFPNDEEVKKEREGFLSNIKDFGNDKEIEKERKVFEEKAISFSKDEENIRIRNDKNFLDVKKNYDCEERAEFGFGEKKRKPMSEKQERTLMEEEKIILSKEEFDEYIRNLNENANIEYKTAVQKDMPVIKKVWKFYRERGRYEKSSFEDFCEQFEVAKTKFLLFGVDIMDTKQLDSLLSKIDKRIERCNGSKSSKTSFVTLAMHYNFYEPVLNKC